MGITQVGVEKSPAPEETTLSTVRVHTSTHMTAIAGLMHIQMLMPMIVSHMLMLSGAATSPQNPCVRLVRRPPVPPRPRRVVTRVNSI